MAASFSPPGVRAVLLGGYTAERDGRAVGIRLLAPPAGEGAHHLREVATIAIPSPSYLVKHPSRPWVFAAGSSEPGQVTSWLLDDRLTLTALGSAAIGGEGACHLALSPAGDQVVVASYSSGTLSSFAVGVDGSLSERLDLLQLDGSGPVPDRQEGPHAHQAVWDGGELLVCDLGSDRVHRLHLDHRGRFSVAAPAVALPPGSGPRHLVLLGDQMVVACELSAQVWLGRRTSSGWEEQQVAASSRSESDSIDPSAIVAEGSRVFLANRGPGTVAVFEVDPHSGVTLTDEFSCGGSRPRDLALTDGLLWSANQTDDRVSVFSTAPQCLGQLVHEFGSPSPSCIVPLVDQPTSP